MQRSATVHSASAAAASQPHLKWAPPLRSAVVEASTCVRQYAAFASSASESWAQKPGG